MRGATLANSSMRRVRINSSVENPSRKLYYSFFHSFWQPNTPYYAYRKKIRMIGKNCFAHCSTVFEKCRWNFSTIKVQTRLPNFDPRVSNRLTVQIKLQNYIKNIHNQSGINTYRTVYLCYCITLSGKCNISPSPTASFQNRNNLRNFFRLL